MKMTMMILLFSILVISTLKPVSAVFSPYRYKQENVALRGKATLSALYITDHLAAFSLPMHGIDGNRDPTYIHGSCFHTSGPKPWWRVDLLHTYTITSVTVTNRGDCCAERIAGAQILIGDSLENNGNNNPQCSVIASMEAGQTKTFNCPQPMTGRYVTVYHPGGEALHLCEVEVNALLPDHSPIN